MTRIQKLQDKGLSLDDSCRVCIFADQGLRWIEKTEPHTHQKEMDKLINSVVKKKGKDVRAFVKHLNKNYFAPADEEVNKEEFEKRWSEAIELLELSTKASGS